MANSTLLQLVTDAAGEMGVPIPATVIGNQTQNVVQLLALVNGLGNKLASEHQWQQNTVEYRFTTQFLDTTGTWTTSAATVTAIPTTAALSAGTWMATGTGIPQDTYILSVDSATQITLTNTPTIAGTAADILFAQTKYTMPSDFDRLIDRTDWDKSQHWELLGPETAQQWQWLKSGFIATGPRVRFRPLGGYFQTWPPISSNDQMGFEYISKYWIYATGAAAVTKARYTVDTDTCIFPDRLMVAGLKKAYYAAKGFAPQWDDEYDMALTLAKSHDAGSQTLSFAPRAADQLISTMNLPDSGFGQ